MAVSPADFELYSRATGAPIPRDPQERMRMAPEVYNFSRNFAREPSGFRKAANTAVKAAKLGSLLAGAYGVSQAFGPEVGAVASAVVDEVTKGNEKPVVEEEPKYQRTSTAVGGLGTKSMQMDRLEEKLADLRGPQPEKTSHVRHPTPFREKMSDISNIGGIYDAVRTDSLRNELNDEFEEPYVRIPTKREPKRDLSAEADAKAAEILGSQLATREGGGQTSDLRRLEEDPRSFLSAASNALIAKTKQEVADFDAGIDWGNTLDQAASADSPVKGAIILGGGVAKKGFHDAKTRIGKDINTAGNIVSEAVANVKKIPAAMQEVDSVIANEQMKASVMPDNQMQEVINSQGQKRIAPNTTIHTGGSIQGSEPGLGAHVDSGSPQTNRRREELKATFSKSLANLPPEQRDAAIDKMLSTEASSTPSKENFEWKRKHYGQKAAERRMRWDDIAAEREQKAEDFVGQYGTREDWAQKQMEQDMAEQDMLDRQVAASREFDPKESTKYAEWGVQKGGRPFVRYQKGAPTRYVSEAKPDLSNRIKTFLTRGGFEYFDDVSPREIIESTMDDPNIKKLNKDQW